MKKTTRKAKQANNPTGPKGKSKYALVEVFYMDAIDVEYNRDNPGHDAEASIDAAGWYWWTCFPGCLPDSDPVGPFNTEQDALKDAQDVD